MHYNSFIDIPLNQLSTLELNLNDNKSVMVTFDIIEQLSAQVEENKRNISLIYNELIPRWGTGDGSETNPYLIYNIHDFIMLDKALKFGFNSEGKHFKQMCDIDLGGITWEGIGNHNTSVFKGIYNGNNKKVTNFTLCKNDYCGLFNGIAGTEQNRCIIKNLEVSCNGVEVDPEDTVLWGAYSPIIARSVNGYITLENLTARGNIGTEELPVGKDCAGGIIAKIDGKKAKLDLTSTAIINNCQNYTDIYINISKCGKAGGMTAYSDNGIQLSNCVNYGKIIYNGPCDKSYNQDYGIGGLIGDAGSSSGGAWIRVIDCSNYGEVLCQSTTQHVCPFGALLGYPRDIEMKGNLIIKNNSLVSTTTPTNLIGTALSTDNDMLQLIKHTYDGTEYYVVAGRPGIPFKIQVPKSVTTGTLVLNVSIIEKIFGTDITTHYPIVTRQKDKSVIEPTKNGSVWTYII